MRAHDGSTQRRPTGTTIPFAATKHRVESVSFSQQQTLTVLASGNNVARRYDTSKHRVVRVLHQTIASSLPTRQILKLVPWVGKRACALFKSTTLCRFETKSPKINMQGNEAVAHCYVDRNSPLYEIRHCVQPR